MTWITTWSGKTFDYAAPSVEAVTIEDVAHALAAQARFAGHTAEPYSVAQHSVFVSEHLPIEFALAGLLHDAHEAYVTDLPRPMKELVPDYRLVEKRAQRVVLAAFGLELPLPEPVALMDMIACCTEAAQLMGKPPRLWAEWVTPLECKLEPWPCETSEERFLDAFQFLIDGREPRRRNCNCARPALVA